MRISQVKLTLLRVMWPQAIGKEARDIAQSQIDVKKDKLAKNH